MGSKDDDWRPRQKPPKAEFWDQIDPNEKPPDNPPIIKFHGPPMPGVVIPEEYRRVFGNPPPEGSKPPVPPPPRPPNSYHKKPKYWQMRGTSHMQVQNRACLVVAMGALGLAWLMDRYAKHGYQRWDRFFGLSMTPEQKEDYDRKNELYYKNILSTPSDAWHTDIWGQNYKNTRRHNDQNVRWDIREVDIDVVNARDLGTPLFDNAL